MTEQVDCVVIGAGVVGLAVARALALVGREVIVLERAGAIGTGVSSRNSEVIHAGMYYPQHSLKAQFCVAGNRMLREYAASHGVPFKMVGKLIVATTADEEKALESILEKGRANDVIGLHAISGSDAKAMEPALSCRSALLSSNTGIIDTHAYMLSLQGEAEANGAVIAFGAPIIAGQVRGDGVEIVVGDMDGTRLLAKTVVISASLAAPDVARSLGLANVPKSYLCKGNYFALTGKMPFERLVYPVPVSAGLGVHYTVDLAGRGRFGPDVEWVERESYDVDIGRAESFYAAIRRYWPELPDGALAPAFAGIRPKIQAPGEPARDFVVAGPENHGAPGVVALFGIESPGLTSSLALADYVKDLVCRGG
ncbi:MAG: NAD(P)/FAD-dependent oxidoreductase [Alphaproteobacteria bacterium]|nr:NAD(P)/FAD-dependent oxidoreductase [Alphaproteobacteria bacterium]